MARVLLVDDEKSIRETLGSFVSADGHDVQIAGDVFEAMEHLDDQTFDVIVTDILMPGLSGMELLSRIHDIAPGTQVIIITGQPTVDTAAEAVRHGAFDYLSKPISRANIIKAVANAARLKQLSDAKTRLEAENRNYQMHLEELVTQRTQALRESEEKYRAAVEHSADNIYILDVKTMCVVEANPALRRFLDYSAEEMSGMHVEQFVSLTSEMIKSAVESVVESGSRFLGERTYLKKDGTGMPVEVSAHFITYGGNEAFCVVSRDISARKEAERLREAEAEKRRNVVVNTAHLIHTPLTVVQGNLELVQQGTLEFSSDMNARLLRRLSEMKELVCGELYQKINLMTVPTSDGFTPAIYSKEVAEKESDKEEEGDADKESSQE